MTALRFCLVSPVGLFRRTSPWYVRFSVIILLMVLGLSTVVQAAGPIVLIKDINDGPDDSSPDLQVVFNDVMYFTAYNPVYGNELWRSDGTTSGTTLVKDVNPGSESSNIFPLVTMDGMLYFAGYSNGEWGWWKSDGTTSGTVLITTLTGEPTWSAVSNHRLFFSAAVDKTHSSNFELWVTDGTASGTQLVKDIYPGIAGSSPTFMTDVNGTLFFRADDGVHGVELWKSDGTSAGTVMVKDIYEGNLPSAPYALTSVQGTLYFVASDVFGNRRLWRSDGTEAGTVQVSSAILFSSYATYQQPVITEMNGSLYFVATDEVHGYELWKSDGSVGSASLVKDIAEGTAESVPHDMKVVNKVLYFVADDGIHGEELWRSDGTAAGTQLVKDIAPGVNSSRPRYLASVNNTLVFIANDGTHGYELWTSGGTGQDTSMVEDLVPGSGDAFRTDSGPRIFSLLKTKVLFTATDGQTGQELRAFTLSSGLGSKVFLPTVSS